jgi:hypothetical protein
MLVYPEDLKLRSRNTVLWVNVSRKEKRRKEWNGMEKEGKERKEREG